MVPSFAQIKYTATLKWGMKLGLQGQIMTQRHDDFKDNFTCSMCHAKGLVACIYDMDPKHGHLS